MGSAVKIGNNVLVIAGKDFVASAGLSVRQQPVNAASVLLPCPGCHTSVCCTQVDLAGGFGEGTTVGTEPALPQSSFPDGARHVGDFFFFFPGERGVRRSGTGSEL